MLWIKLLALLFGFALLDFQTRRMTKVFRILKILNVSPDNFSRRKFTGMRWRRWARLRKYLHYCHMLGYVPLGFGPTIVLCAVSSMISPDWVYEQRFGLGRIALAANILYSGIMYRSVALIFAEANRLHRLWSAGFGQR